ncbi:hypothetical protein [uncultured Roseobacter sp.]|uniref:hypothetical protein n=1 Tax=uncultured Roseobacter sp. TaxID=114847 RepID=UPI0026052D99|nr:hypothetical protein [uncultured Roseobacter sp.]
MTGLIGVLAALAGLVVIQPTEPSVQESFRGGLELFRMVQTEPVGARLIRYATSLVTSTGKALISFWPVMTLTAALMLHPRRWLAILTLCVLVLNIILEKNYLAGMTSQFQMAEALYALFILLVMISFRAWSVNSRIALLFVSLLILPFGITVGTGNSLFTQIIISLAPWTIVAALLSWMSAQSDALRLLQHGLTAVFLILVSAQVTSSYLREPYHLQEPLIAQTRPVSVGPLGTVKVDKATAQLLSDIEKAKRTCSIEPGAQFLGLFNVPGLALVFEAIPPISPWLNNSAQASTVLQYWNPETAARVVTVLAPEAHIDMSTLPERLRPEPNGYVFCGTSEIPYENRKIEIWASPIPLR